MSTTQIQSISSFVKKIHLCMLCLHLYLYTLKRKVLPHKEPQEFLGDYFVITV